MTPTPQVRQWSAQGKPVRGRPLWVEANGHLLLGDDAGAIKRFDPVSGSLHAELPSPYPLSKRLFSRSRLAARLLRLIPRAFVRLPSGTSLWVAGGHLWRFATGDQQAQAIMTFTAGHGPLFLALTPNGSVVFGDYVATRAKLPSAIRRSEDDGRTWSVVYEFSADRIRHVHGAFWDPYAGAVCLTTGDADHEAGLWTLEQDVPRLIAGGRALYRVVQPVFTPDAIVFGTDTPGDDCGIYRLSRADGSVRQLIATRGPVFFGTTAGSSIAFSTVVEPGHPEANAGLYVGNATGDFHEALTLRKDRWDMRLFQYGQVHLPANSSAHERIWFTPCATSSDNRLCSLETVRG